MRWLSLLPVSSRWSGYYIAEGFIYGNWIAPATSIPGNLVQIGVAAIIVIPIAERLRITVQKRL